MPYIVLYTYDPNLTLGKAEVLGRYGEVHIADAAKAFVDCGAPYTQLAWETDDGDLEELDVEEALVDQLFGVRQWQGDMSTLRKRAAFALKDRPLTIVGSLLVLAAIPLELGGV